MEERRAKKKNLFEHESNILSSSKVVIANEDITLEEAKAELISLNAHYEDLVDQSKLITKVSDRLQKKINKANDALESKNNELSETLDALTKAKVGRRATTITLVIFVVLFLVTEAFVEPPIEELSHEWFKGNETADMAFSLGVKGALALLLRPIEKIVEGILVKREKAKKEQEAEMLRNQGQDASVVN